MVKTVWITGAGSGIGKALALGFAKKKYQIILSGRKTSTLELAAEICRDAGGKTIVAPLDLADSDSIDYAILQVRQKVDKLDILINNGGISQRSLIAETPDAVDRQIFETNYFGTIALTKRVLPWMVETGGGIVSVISSISGLFGFPLRSSYSASKHAVSGYFETIGIEYMDKGIHSTVVYPGRIATDISINAVTASGESQKTMDKGLKNGMPVQECAAKIIKGIERRKRRVLVGRKELLLVHIHTYFPWLFWKIIHKIDPK